MKKRNKFNLDKPLMTTFDMGELVPIGVTEVLPGDTFNHSTSALVRLAPLNSPVMHPCHVIIHHWFVQTRNLWVDFENYITGGPDGTSAPVKPYITTPVSTGFTIGSLGDYLGLKPGVASRQVSALPFRAYAFLVNNCYRDQDLMPLVGFSTASGADTTTNTALQNVAWGKDYETTARPWEQKGVEVSSPLAGTAPVLGLGVKAAAVYTTSGAGFNESDGTAGSGSNWSLMATNDMAIQGNNTTKIPAVYVDGADFEAPSINEQRFAYAWQRVLEARSRNGSRYPELLRAWGIMPDDATINRPVYLGGGKQTIQFSEVLGTSSTNLADLGGHGIGAMRSNRYNKTFKEHGYVISLMFVRPIGIYSDGIERFWTRTNREQEWQPELQHLGQQTVYNDEIDMASASPRDTFGFQDRGDEWRRGFAHVTGEMRPGGIHDTYTMARGFGSPPALNETFVKCVPTKDIFQAPSEDGLIVMINHSIKARRLVSKSGNSFIR